MVCRVREGRINDVTSKLLRYFKKNIWKFQLNSFNSQAENLIKVKKAEVKEYEIVTLK